MKVRAPAVAGLFYDNNASHLVAQLSNWLPAVQSTESKLPNLSAIIVPHAGYRFSGAIAALAYQALQQQVSCFKRVILLGPSHKVAFNGCALSSCDAFATPMGMSMIDQACNQQLAHHQEFVYLAAAHAKEHSLEVQLPFLQHLLPHCPIVPIVTGRIEPARLAAHLAPIWDPHTLLVISSDLSHFHPYHEAQRMDQHTCAQISACAATITAQQACGSTAINTLLLMAKAAHYQLTLLDAINSGDRAGDKQRVVGYASYTATQTQHIASSVGKAKKRPSKQQATQPTINDSVDFEQLTHEEMHRLLVIAKQALTYQVRQQAIPELDLDKLPYNLQRRGACFVTLEVNGALQGCLGTLAAINPLALEVHQRAIASCSKDTRFKQIRESQLPSLSIEVSVLSANQKLQVPSEQALCRYLKQHQCGVILAEAGKRAVFLPQVWEKLPEPAQFLRHLKLKGGWPAHYWSPEMQVYIFQVRKTKANYSDIM